MADLTITAKCVDDCSAAATTEAIYEIVTSTKKYFGGYRQITLELDTSNNYFAIRMNNANVYRYVPGDTFATAAVADAAAMYVNARNAISS